MGGRALARVASPGDFADVWRSRPDQKADRQSLGVGAKATVARWKVHRDAANSAGSRAQDADNRDRTPVRVGERGEGGKRGARTASENGAAAGRARARRDVGYGLHSGHQHLARRVGVSKAVAGCAEARAQTLRTVEYAGRNHRLERGRDPSAPPRAGLRASREVVDGPRGLTRERSQSSKEGYMQ